MNAQTIIVLLVIAAAAVHLSRYLWRAIGNMIRKKESGGCPACAECAFAPTKSSSAPAVNFISLDQIQIN